MLSNATDYMALTCSAHIIAAMYTFPTLTFDQVHQVLSLHWPAAMLFLVATGVLWPNLPHALTRLAMQSVCIGFVFAISVRATLSRRLSDQMDCVQLLLDRRAGAGAGSGGGAGFQHFFRVSIMMFPAITLLFWIWTLVAVAVAQWSVLLLFLFLSQCVALLAEWRADRAAHSRPFSKLRRFINVYADLALVCIPVAIVLVALNISQNNKRLAVFQARRPSDQWSFGQFFALLMVGGSLYEVFKGFVGI